MHEETGRPLLSAIAVDTPGTHFREDAISISALPGVGWKVAISVLDRNSGGSRQKTSHAGFTVGVAKDAQTFLFFASGSGRFALQSVMPTSVSLVATYDGNRGQSCSYLERDPALMTMRAVSDAISRSRGGNSSPHPQRQLSAILVAANTACAAFMSNQGKLLLYRSFKDGAPLATSPSSKSNMHADAYARFSSPGRREEDLINLNCIIAAFNSQPEPYSQTELASIVARLSASELAASSAKPAEKAGAALPSKANKTMIVPGLSRQELADMTVVGFWAYVATMTGAIPQKTETEMEMRLNRGEVGLANVVYLVKNLSKMHNSARLRSRLIAEIGDDMLSGFLERCRKGGLVSVTASDGAFTARMEAGAGCESIEISAGTRAAAIIAARRHRACDAAEIEVDLTRRHTGLIKPDDEEMLRQLTDLHGQSTKVFYEPRMEGFDCSLTLEDELGAPCLNFQAKGASKQQSYLAAVAMALHAHRVEEPPFRHGDRTEVAELTAPTARP